MVYMCAPTWTINPCIGVHDVLLSFGMVEIKEAAFAGNTKSSVLSFLYVVSFPYLER